MPCQGQAVELFYPHIWRFPKICTETLSKIKLKCKAPYTTIKIADLRYKKAGIKDFKENSITLNNFDWE